MSSGTIRRLFGAILAVVIFSATAGACAPAPAPKPATPAHAMQYVGSSGYKGYQEKFVATATFCLKTYVPGEVKYFTVRKGTFIHLKGEDDISFQTLFTWVKNGKVGTYVIRWWIDSTEANRKPTGACKGPNIPIIG